MNSETMMRDIVLSPPKFGFVVATRGALALGVGLLVANRLDDDKRRAVGAALVTVGVLSTIPALMLVRQSRRGRTGRVKPRAA
jgi:hypothetical protein